MNDTMSRLEKIALTSAISGAVFNVFLYGIGARLDEIGAAWSLLFVLRVVAAIAQAAAFDLVAVATVMGMRAGRRGRWSIITAVASALVSAMIALDVAGVVQLPILHAANALIVLAFTLHLLTPRSLARDDVDRLTTLEQALADREQVVTDLEQTLTCREQELTRVEQALATARQELSSRATPATVDVIYVATHRLTWRQFEQAVGTLRHAETLSMSTIRRRVAELAAPMTEEIA